MEDAISTHVVSDTDGVGLLLNDSDCTAGMSTKSTLEHNMLLPVHLLAAAASTMCRLANVPFTANSWKVAYSPECVALPLQNLRGWLESYVLPALHALAAWPCSALAASGE